MKYQDYPRYKPSGVDWLGDVPEHWNVKRGRFCMLVNPRSSRLRELGPEDEVSFVPMEAIGEHGGLNLERICAIRDIGASYTEFDEGDVLVAKITPCFENGKGSLAAGLLNGAAFGTTELHILRPRSALDRRFLFYLTISSPFRQSGEGEMYGAGGQKRVPPDFCRDFQVPLPSLSEQHTIADFLDAKTAELEALVAKKRALIEKLKEKRAALVSRTVTRGLPPEAARAAGLEPYPKLKPSGIEWLGDVPEHWEVKRLKFQLRQLEQGWSPQCDNAPAGIDEWGVLKAGCVNAWAFDPHENKRLPADVSPQTQYEVRSGDILMSRANTTALLGSTVLIREIRPRLLLCDKLYRLNVKDSILCKEYLVNFLQCPLGRYEFERDATGASNSMQNIGQDSVRNLWMPIPPLNEQQAIVSYISAETSKLDAIRAATERTIALLKEHRAALITAAVTGKIDVRGAIP